MAQNRNKTSISFGVISKWLTGLLGSLTCVSSALSVGMNEVLHFACKLSGKITSEAAKIVAVGAVSGNMMDFLQICWAMQTKWFIRV